MRSVLYNSLLVAAVVVFTASTTLVLAVPELTLKQCTDTLLCRDETCKQEVQVPTGICGDQSNKSSDGKQLLICNPNVAACGELWVYSDPHCTVPVDSEALACNQCDIHKKQKVECINKNGHESILVEACSDDQCQKCEPAMAIEAGVCFQTQNEKTGATQWLKYEGARLCTVVDAFMFNKKSSCEWPPTEVKMWALDRCILGNVFHCHYDSDNSTTTKQQKCPQQQARKSECVSAIANCFDVCRKKEMRGKNGGCHECVRRNNAAKMASSKQCCQTLSYYLGFGCDECEDL